MKGLLADIISAHGGMERWDHFAKVQASMVSGGGFFCDAKWSDGRKVNSGNAL
jgi:hypothetical protein